MKADNMPMLEDGYHYKGTFVIYVYKGRVEKLFCIYHQRIEGFILKEPITAWNMKYTWTNILRSKVKLMNNKQLQEDLGTMPYKCKIRLRNTLEENNE